MHRTRQQRHRPHTTKAEAAPDRIAKAQAEIDARQVAVEQARSDEDAADRKAAEAETALAELQQAVTDAENEATRIEARDREAIDAAQAVINQGSAGFFKEQSATDKYAGEAYNIVTGNTDKKHLASNYDGVDRSDILNSMYKKQTLEMRAMQPHSRI